MSLFYKNFLKKSVAGLWLLSISISSYGETELLDRIVAVVEDQVITQSQLTARITQLRAQLAHTNASLPSAAVFEQQVLDQLISEQLQAQLAENLGLTTNNASVDRAVANIAAQNQMTVEQLYQQLEDQNLSVSDFREAIRQEITLTRLQRRMVDDQINITEREIDRIFNQNQKQLAHQHQYRLGHILIALPENPSTTQVQNSLNKSEQILSQINDGIPFEQLAISHSDSPTALQGGDLGLRRTIELPTLFAQEVNSMTIGEVRGPFRNASGYHLITLTEKQTGPSQLSTQTQARHILIQTNEVRDEAQAKKLIDDIYQQVLLDEQRFDNLARQHSGDLASASQGGELGWTTAGEWVPEFQRQADQLQPGQISAPFASQFGWHIVQVHDRRQIDSSEIIARNQIRDTLEQVRFEEARELWLVQLRDQATVEIRL